MAKALKEQPKAAVKDLNRAVLHAHKPRPACDCQHTAAHKPHPNNPLGCAADCSCACVRCRLQRAFHSRDEECAGLRGAISLTSAALGLGVHTAPASLVVAAKERTEHLAAARLEVAQLKATIATRQPAPSMPAYSLPWGSLEFVAGVVAGAAGTVVAMW